MNKNAYGSIDLHFGPTKPDGVADKNLMQTAEGRDFITCIRLYDADIKFFDQTKIGLRHAAYNSSLFKISKI